MNLDEYLHSINKGQGGKEKYTEDIRLHLIYK